MLRATRNEIGEVLCKYACVCMSMRVCMCTLLSTVTVLTLLSKSYLLGKNVREEEKKLCNGVNPRRG